MAAASVLRKLHKISSNNDPFGLIKFAPRLCIKKDIRTSDRYHFRRRSSVLGMIARLVELPFA